MKDKEQHNHVITVLIPNENWKDFLQKRNKIKHEFQKIGVKLQHG